MLSTDELRGLNERFERAPTDELLAWLWGRFGDGAVIGTSFQGAGLVMLDLAARAGLRFPVFTLDTGLLFPETVALKGRLERHFGLKIEALEPDLSVEQQASAFGPELWQRDPDMCCTIRKVTPLQSRLSRAACWMTGVRREQSDVRSGAGLLEVYVVDPASGQEIVKANPMALWSREAIWKHIRERGIPYNPLQDRGYRSIGCVPCTRAVGEGESERAGRWTGFGKTECGIHTFMAKRGG